MNLYDFTLNLKRFDTFLCSTNIKQIELPKEIVLQWAEKQANEEVSTHQHRLCMIRQIAELMVRLGYSAYILPEQFGTTRSYRFSPHIYTHKEIQQIIHAIDNMKPSVTSPMKHVIMPEIFRLLYACGFRVGEVLNLRVQDVDFQQGVIIVREGKFGKDRLVPPALDIVERLKIYSERLKTELLEKQTDQSYFFPSRTGQAWSHSGVCFFFKEILYQCGISHVGKKMGPRIHDLRYPNLNKIQTFFRST
jgi:integrase/recombinase XerD